MGEVFGSSVLIFEISGVLSEGKWSSLEGMSSGGVGVPSW